MAFAIYLLHLHQNNRGGNGKVVWIHVIAVTAPIAVTAAYVTVAVILAVTAIAIAAIAEAR
jgi:hypothetical protein